MATLFAGRPCTDPLTLSSELRSERWGGRANTFTTGPGRAPGRGHILLRLSDLQAIDDTADHDLAFSGTDASHQVVLSPITLLHTECVTPGAETDPAAVYLCEVVDRRHLLGRYPWDKAYNLSSADGSTVLSQTLNSGSQWTWQQVVQDLATGLGIGTLTLPFTPNGTPANLQYYGHPSALACLCDVLARLACDLAYDPVTNAFAAVRLGAAGDTDLDAIAAPRTWDGYPSETVRGYYPEYVRVRFPRRPVDTASGYSPYYVVDVALTEAAGVESGTYVQIDDDLSALASSGTPSNASALASRASERATDWLRKRQAYDRPVLRAWLDFVPGAAGLGAYAVRRVVFDDRGTLQTWARAEPDGALEAWRPLGGWPVWWPLATSSGSSLTVQLASGTPTYANTTTLQFDQTVGFSLSQPVAGTALVSLTVPPVTGTANTVPQYTASGSGLQSTPQYVTSVSAGSGYTYTQSTVPNVGASTSTGPVLQYVIDTSSGTPTLTIRQYTNGTSGGNGQSQVLTPTQFQTSYALGGTTGTETVTASGGVIQRTASNVNLTGYTIPVSQLTGSTLPSGITGSSLTSLGTIGTGVWQGTVVNSLYGGTGVNNGSSTITLGGNLTTSGAYPLQFTVSGSTAVTLPTSGTLASQSYVASTYVPQSQLGVASGVAQLDGSGKLTSSQIPTYLTSATSLQGTWNASTNTPTLASSTGTTGYMYIVSVAGTTNLNGITQWNVGDWAIFTPAGVWEKLDGLALEVTSVAGRTGAVTLSTGDISGLGTAATYAATAFQAANTSLAQIAAGTWVGATSITTLGTVGTGVWQGTAVATGYGGTGLTTVTAYAVICGGTTSTGTLQQVSGIGATAGQVLTYQGASALPTWTSPSSGPAPTGAPTLSATAGNAQITLGITLATGASNTYVYRGTSSSVTNLTGTLVYSGTGTSYTDTGLTNGTTYYYVGYGWNNGALGPASSVVSQTPTSDTVLDTYTASNGTDPTSRACDTGQTPSALSNSFQINSDACSYNSGSNEFSILAYNTGKTNQTVSAQFSAAADTAYPILFARLTDVNNYYSLECNFITGYTYLVKCVSGIRTTLATYIGSGMLVGALLKIVVTGPSLAGYLNGSSVVTAMDSALTTGNNAAVGDAIFGSTVTHVVWDNFTVQ